MKSTTSARRALLIGLCAASGAACGAAGAPAPPRAPEPAREEVMPDAAAAMIMKACYAESSAMACAVLAALFQEGILGYKKDEAAADELFARAGALMALRCEEGDAQQCMLLGGLMTVRMEKLPAGDPEITRIAGKAVPLLERACRGGEGDACAALGEIHAEGRGVDRDMARADDLYNKACDAGAPRGCLSLAELRALRGDHAAAVAAYARGCDAAEAEEAARPKDDDDEPSSSKESKDPPWWAEICHKAGHMLITGDGIPADAPRAAEYYERACGHGSLGACLGLGVLHERGSIGPVDPARARALYRKACDGGDDRACQEIQRLNGPNRKTVSPWTL